MIINQNQKEQQQAVLLICSISGFIIGLFITFSHVYYTNYDLLNTLHCNNDWLDINYFAKEGAQVFNNTLRMRIYALIALSTLLIYPADRERGWTLKQSLTLFAGGSMTFLLTPLVHFLPIDILSQILDISMTTFSVAVIAIGAIATAKYYMSAKRNSYDENEMLSDGFVQNNEYVENKYSVNLKYTYRYKMKEYTGWINVVNPFRASSVIGTPGSGKSYAVLEEYMRQLINKDFCGIIYDYKDPTLSKLANSYLEQHNAVSTKDIKTQFAYISFKYFNKTYRCNPIKGISSSAEAIDTSTVLLAALNKSITEKQGEFFTESGIKFTALNMYVLSIIQQGKYLSIPHLIAMLGTKPSKLFPALKIISIFYADMGALFSPFSDAYDNNVVNQLSGQIATALIGLGAMSDEMLAYVMTEEKQDADIILDMDVNNPKHPRLLCIGSDPEKDKIYGLANSVYLSRLSKKINKANCTPCLFAVDECSTVYINGIDTTIATARSNKVAVLLGFQDYSQLTRDYGEKIANVTINTVGNTFSGAVKGLTAKNLSDSFGEKKIEKVQKSISSEGNVSTTITEQREKKITPDMIEELSSGSFVGRIADDFGNKVEHKAFYGMINIDPAVKQCREIEIPDVRTYSDFDAKRKLKLNLNRVKDEVINVVNTLKSICDYHTILMRITSNSDDNTTGVSLENYINNPSDETLPQLCLWLEEAHFIVGEIKKCNLLNDVLTEKEMLEMLIKDVYDNPEGLPKIFEAIAKKNLDDINVVKYYVSQLVVKN